MEALKAQRLAADELLELEIDQAFEWLAGQFAGEEGDQRELQE